jgi:hypothetical protein
MSVLEHDVGGLAAEFEEALLTVAEPWLMMRRPIAVDPVKLIRSTRGSVAEPGADHVGERRALGGEDEIAHISISPAENT